MLRQPPPSRTWLLSGRAKDLQQPRLPQRQQSPRMHNGVLAFFFCLVYTM